MRVVAANNQATLVLPEALAEELLRIVCNQVETAGVLVAHVVRGEDGEARILGNRFHWIGDTHYQHRTALGMSISSDGYTSALAETESQSAMAIWVHTHPGIDAIPLPSVHDEIVDEQIADPFRVRTGSAYYGALIVSPRHDGFTFSGHLAADTGEVWRIEHVWTVGDRLKLYQAFDSAQFPLAELFDRNIKAFGDGVQRTLGSLAVAVVGCGGTGSAVAEQLVRLGVRQLVLVDPDVLSSSNVTRVYGSTAVEVGRPKVDSLGDHLVRIAPDCNVLRISSRITQLAVAKRLRFVDVVFGCTDDNAGRLVLSRMATYFLTPVFDCGVIISSDKNGAIIGIDGRVTTLAPGQGCLVCRGRIDLSLAAAEMLSPTERRRREHEGYAPALGRIEPAVVSYTTSVAAAAVSELIDRLVGYGPKPTPSETILRFHEREVSTNHSAPLERHYCHAASGKWGLGMTDPFLEQAWPE